MRKRILPALLAFALLLSIVPVAFAAVPMTLVQQTTGDPNKEFVYYIKTDDVEIDVDTAPNVEILSKKEEHCQCGLIFDSLYPDFQEKYNEHYDPFGDNWWHGSMVETREEPSDPQYVIDTPAHDESYCTICGAIK